MKQSEQIARKYSEIIQAEIHPPSFEALVNTANKDNIDGTDSGAEQIYIGFEVAQEIRNRAFAEVMGRELNEDSEADYVLYFESWEIARKNLYYSQATIQPDEIGNEF